jgi:hypothetical protein
MSGLLNGDIHEKISQGLRRIRVVVRLEARSLNSLHIAIRDSKVSRIRVCQSRPSYHGLAVPVRMLAAITRIRDTP